MDVWASMVGDGVMIDKCVLGSIHYTLVFIYA